jgi:hypothetical protein
MPQRVPLCHEVGEGQGEGLSSHPALSVKRHRPHPNPLPQAGEGDAIAAYSAAAFGAAMNCDTNLGHSKHHVGKPIIIELVPGRRAA